MGISNNLPNTYGDIINKGEEAATFITPNNMGRMFALFHTYRLKKRTNRH
jgi:hypothetical protein